MKQKNKPMPSKVLIIIQDRLTSLDAAKIFPNLSPERPVPTPTKTVIVKIKKKKGLLTMPDIMMRGLIF